MRYFLPSHALEFNIPLEQLRTRDPQTGLILPTYEKQTKEQIQATFNDTTITKLDFKGAYGVAFVWSDGHYADIFPFDTLRKIGEELQEIAKNPDATKK